MAEVRRATFGPAQTRRRTPDTNFLGAGFGLRMRKRGKMHVLDSSTADMAPRFLVHSSPWQADLALERLFAHSMQLDGIHAERPVCAHGAD